MAYCGDCGVETVVKGRYRVCPSCATRTRIAKPKPVKMRKWDGGVQGVCLNCGCSLHECEC